MRARRIVDWLDGNRTEHGDQRPAEALRGVDGRYVILVAGARPLALAAWLEPAGYRIMQEFDQPETGDHIIIIKCDDFDCYIDMIRPDRSVGSGETEVAPEIIHRELVAWLEKQGYKIVSAERIDDPEPCFGYRGSLYGAVIEGVTDDIDMSFDADRVIWVCVTHPKPSVGPESIDLDDDGGQISTAFPARPIDLHDPKLWEELQAIITQELDNQREAQELVASTVADLKRVFEHLPAHTAANALESVALGIYRHLEALAEDWNPRAAIFRPGPANGQDQDPQARQAPG
jgi:hypothetical protein